VGNVAQQAPLALQELLNLLRHVIEGPRKMPELVFAFGADTCREIAFPEALHRPLQPAQRGREMAREDVAEGNNGHEQPEPLNASRDEGPLEKEPVSRGVRQADVEDGIVPDEPATLLLLLAGCAGGVARWRRPFPSARDLRPPTF
jgi:hypothetical protein